MFLLNVSESSLQSSYWSGVSGDHLGILKKLEIVLSGISAGKTPASPYASGE
jgi:hypothetical protein